MNAVTWPRAGSWSLSSGAVEALKLAAFAAMLIDHANTVFFGRDVAWMYNVGRFAMPVFSLVLAYNLARPGADGQKLLLRLLLWGVAAHPWVMLTINGGSSLPGNVLLSFAVAVAIVRFPPLLTVPLCLVGSLLLDYSFAVLLLVPAAVWWFKDRHPVALVGMAAGILGLCLLNGNAWALVGVSAFFAAGSTDPKLPRMPWLFWIGYPAHLMVLAILSRL